MGRAQPAAGGAVERQVSIAWQIGHLIQKRHAGQVCSLLLRGEQGVAQGGWLAFHPRHLPAQLPQLLDAVLQVRQGREGVLPSAGLRTDGSRTAGGRQAWDGSRAQVDLPQLAGEDQAFHQRVAGQAIGTMHAAAGHFAHRVQPGQGGGGLVVGANATHPVVGRRCHRDRCGGGFESQLAAASQDRWELSFQPRHSHRPQIKPEVGQLTLPHPLDQGAADGIAGGEVTAGQLSHGTVAPLIHQPSSFAAHRFGDQEMGGTRQHQRCGVKLHELQVADHRSRLPSHGDAIAAGLGGIGGVGEQVAATAGGQHHRPRMQPLHPLPIQHLQAAAASLLHQQLQGQHSGATRQALTRGNPAFESLHQSTAGTVLGVEHPAVAVGGLQGCAQDLAVTVEVHAQLQQSLHAGRGFTHQQGNSGGVAQTGPRAQGVLHMAVETVLGSGHSGDPPLGPAAGRAGRAAVLVEQQDPQPRRQFQGGHQTRSATADNDHIPLAGQLGHQGGSGRCLQKSRREGPAAWLSRVNVRPDEESPAPRANEAVSAGLSSVLLPQRY